LDTQNGIETLSTDPTSIIVSELARNQRNDDIVRPFTFQRKSTIARESKVFLEVAPRALQDLLNKKATSLKMAIPVDDDSEIELELIQNEVLAPFFHVETSSGKLDFTFQDKILFYKGIVKNHEKAIVAVSVHMNGIRILIQDPIHVYTLDKIVKADGEYVFSVETFDNPNASFTCHVDDEQLPFPSDMEPLPSQKRTPSTCPVYLYLEADNESYNFYSGDVSAVVMNIVDVLADVIMIYDNFGVPILISTIKVWDTADPYGVWDPNSSTPLTMAQISSQLTQFGIHLTNTQFVGKLAHLFMIGMTSAGGLAGTDQLCGANPYGVSNIETATMSNSVQLVAHELGHNFGSQHTNRCVWGPNNDMAIDNCSTLELGPCSVLNDINANPSYVGTIMSRCIPRTLNFHAQPQALIISRYQSALTSCINEYYCTLYEDNDGDGYGGTTTWAYGDSGVPTFNSADCNDANASINPTIVEDCSNSVDDNCNGVINENTLALDFDGVDDVVDLGSSLGNFGTSDFTIEGWIKTTTVDKTIMSKRSMCDNSNYWFINIPPNGKVHMEANLVAGGTSTTTVSDGSWHHFAFVRNGVNFSTYVDGVLEATNGIGSTVTLTNPAPLILGNQGCPAYFDGAMDELRFWNIGLTANVINAYYNAFLPTSVPGLIAYYDFNNNDAVGGGSNSGQTTLLDLTATFNGTLQNFALSGANSNWIGNPIQSGCGGSVGTYCTADGGEPTFEKISNVMFNTIDNASTSTVGYEDFTSISTVVDQGATYNFTGTIAIPYSGDQIIVWIDYNQDMDFDDTGEEVFASPIGVGPHSGSIVIPATALHGPTRMRVRLHDATSGGTNATPCGSSDFGQVEDYTIDIQDPACSSVAVSCGIAYNGTTIGAASDIPSYTTCVGWDESGPEVIHRIIVTSPGDLTVTISNLNADLDIFLLSDDCMAGSCLAFGDFTFTTSVTAGIYYVAVDGYNGVSSAYTLLVECPGGSACPPTNNVTGTIVSGTYQAQNELLSDGTVLNGNNVIFKAGNGITLLENFEAQLGSILEAIIEACTPLQENEED
jgi:hypothetical protein